MVACIGVCRGEGSSYGVMIVAQWQSFYASTSKVVRKLNISFKITSILVLVISCDCRIRVDVSRSTVSSKNPGKIREYSSEDETPSSGSLLEFKNDTDMVRALTHGYDAENYMQSFHSPSYAGLHVAEQRHHQQCQVGKRSGAPSSLALASPPTIQFHQLCTHLQESNDRYKVIRK